MKTIARLVTRLQGEGDGLFIGVTMKDHNFFEPNTVYEVVDVLGQHIIRKVGQGVVAEEGETVAASPVRLHWSTEIGYVIGVGGASLFLTREELAAHSKQLEDEYNERDL